jgi:hypothetical protein
MRHRILAVPAVLAALLGSVFLASSAGAITAPTTVTATTQISNRPDNGHGTPPRWAYDDFSRKLVVTVAADSACTSLPVGDTCYTATLTDTGTFSTILGAGTPSGAGGQISHQLTGSLNGTYSLTAYAPAADLLTGTVPATEDDSFTDPVVSSTAWLTQAFATPADVHVDGGAYSWKYKTTCETWTDASTNSDGTIGAGNITGLNFCAVSSGSPIQVRNRATGRCLNENQATGLLSTYACEASIYASLRWRSVTYSDGTRDLVSVQTGKSVRDNGLNAQLSLTTGQAPVQFQTGGLIRFSDSLLVGVNRQGNFVPVIGSPSFRSLNNVRWDYVSF